MNVVCWGSHAHGYPMLCSVYDTHEHDIHFIHSSMSFHFISFISFIACLSVRLSVCLPDGGDDDGDGGGNDDGACDECSYLRKHVLLACLPCLLANTRFLNLI